MASATFKRLPDQSNGRRRYTVEFDSAGKASPRKKQMSTAEVMTPKYIVGPRYITGGADRNAPFVAQ